METRNGAQRRSTSKTSKLLKIFLSWFQEEPVSKRASVRRSGSLQRPSNVGKAKVWVGCCWIILCVLAIRYVIMRIPITILNDSHLQSERSKENDMFGLRGYLEDLKPNPAKMSPTDWDLAFIETPRINLEKWGKSFESCFFEQKLINELKF